MRLPVRLASPRLVSAVPSFASSRFPQRIDGSTYLLRPSQSVGPHHVLYDRLAVAARCRWLSMSRTLRFPVATYSSLATSLVQPQTTVGHRPQGHVIPGDAIGGFPPAFHVCPNASTCNVSVVIRRLNRLSPFLSELLDRATLL